MHTKKNKKPTNVDNTTSDTEISLEKQLEIFDTITPSLDMAKIMQQITDELLEDSMTLARERLIAGYDTYKDKNFFKTIKELKREQSEEIADTINYQVFIEWRREHGYS